MAMYEYKCKSCEQSVTIARSISSREDVPICVGCKSPLSRVYSSVGVTFSGSGFYSTDK
jgi:putative FmdB family regulatory protein